MRSPVRHLGRRNWVMQTMNSARCHVRAVSAMVCGDLASGTGGQAAPDSCVRRDREKARERLSPCLSTTQHRRRLISKTKRRRFAPKPKTRMKIKMKAKQIPNQACGQEAARKRGNHSLYPPLLRDAFAHTCDLLNCKNEALSSELGWCVVPWW